ncbi:MAG: RluA family pseudouridine synthase [Ruminococcaceae bacterium]|nr:RluA family pseudouridine synthase [Oscillospiraceae bacterium]
MEILISKNQEEKTVGQILRGDLQLSSKIISFLKKKPDGILLNGVHATVRNKVMYNDLLCINYKDEDEPFDKSRIEPTDLPFAIVYQDEDILLVNKPAGMPTHPSHDHQRDTLANGLAHMCKVVGSPFVFRPVNRLDKDTSGLVLVAKNKLAAYRLSEAMKKGEIHKSYVAVLCGTVTEQTGELMDFMRRAPDSKMLREICQENDEGAMMAFTKYKKIVSNDMFSLVVAAPITGRTHQLRLQFAGYGHPLVGDTLYGYPYEHIGRQALHAFRLSFPHPITQKRLQFSVPLPKDLSTLCQKLFGCDDFSF